MACYSDRRYEREMRIAVAGLYQHWLRLEFTNDEEEAKEMAREAIEEHMETFPGITINEAAGNVHVDMLYTTDEN